MGKGFPKNEIEYVFAQILSLKANGHSGTVYGLFIVKGYRSNER